MNKGETAVAEQNNYCRSFCHSAVMWDFPFLAVSLLVLTRGRGCYFPSFVCVLGGGQFDF